jgi:hypothetical protein
LIRALRGVAARYSPIPLKPVAHRPHSMLRQRHGQSTRATNSVAYGVLFGLRLSAVIATAWLVITCLYTPAFTFQIMTETLYAFALTLAAIPRPSTGHRAKAT